MSTSWTPEAVIAQDSSAGQATWRRPSQLLVLTKLSLGLVAASSLYGYHCGRYTGFFKVPKRLWILGKCALDVMLYECALETLVQQCHRDLREMALLELTHSSHFLLSSVHTPALGCPYYSDISLWRGLNWDTDLSNQHDSVSSPGPPMTKALLQSHMPASPLEIHLSGDFLKSSIGRLLVTIPLVSQQ